MSVSYSSPAITSGFQRQIASITQHVFTKTKTTYKTANTDPATINTSPVAATLLSDAAFVVEIGKIGPVLVVATAAELTEPSIVLPADIAEVTTV
jgi:hypothetical protein